MRASCSGVPGRSWGTAITPFSVAEALCEVCPASRIAERRSHGTAGRAASRAGVVPASCRAPRAARRGVGGGVAVRAPAPCPRPCGGCPAGTGAKSDADQPPGPDGGATLAAIRGQKGKWAFDSICAVFAGTRDFWNRSDGGRETRGTGITTTVISRWPSVPSFLGDEGRPGARGRPRSRAFRTPGPGVVPACRVARKRPHHRHRRPERPRLRLRARRRRRRADRPPGTPAAPAM